MTTNQTIDGVPRADLQEIYEHMVADWYRIDSEFGPCGRTVNYAMDKGELPALAKLRALLDDKSAPCEKSQVEGKRERFQKWVMATKHPVYGFLDGRSLARGDDRTGYADEYVQGLWVAYPAFGAEQPAPVAVVLPERKARDGFGEFSPHSNGWNACLDEVARLNPKE